MSDDTAPKTAYELAMERLRKKDADAGITRQPMTEAQKAAVAEVRNFYESKLAELEVLHQGELRRLFDAEQRAVLEQRYQHDRERLVAERDAKVEKVRSNS